MNEKHSYRFWTVSTFRPEHVAPFATTSFAEVLPYVTGFLCAPHPHREGPVCPFVPSALKKNNIFFTTCAEDDTLQAHTTHIERSIEFYLSHKVGTIGFGALIILFPKEYNIGKLLELHLN